jgi:hypothetical protein
VLASAIRPEGDVITSGRDVMMDVLRCDVLMSSDKMNSLNNLNL